MPRMVDMPRVCIMLGMCTGCRWGRMAAVGSVMPCMVCVPSMSIRLGYPCDDAFHQDAATVVMSSFRRIWHGGRRRRLLMLRVVVKGMMMLARGAGGLVGHKGSPVLTSMAQPSRGFVSGFVAG
jgi:hypothetical protein